MTILNVGTKIRCIAHYSTSTKRGNVYEIGKVVGTNTDGRITYHYVDDDADDANMDTVSHDSLATYFEVVTPTDVIKLALVGKMRSGKDAVGTLLTTRHGFNPPFAFGDALKASAHYIFPDVPRTPKPRALYQFMNVMREYDPDVWIKHVERSVEWALERKTTKGIVITDARQANEIEWCKSQGFLIVRVTAPEHIRIERAQSVGDVFDYEDLSHPTETEVDGFDADHVLVNDGNYADLVSKVDSLIAEIKGEIR